MKKEVIKYTKDQILEVKNLDYSKDVLEIMLEKDQMYTLDEVKKLCNDFLKKEVK